MNRKLQDSDLGAARVRALALAVLAAYSYCLSEWLFFATKPSFLSALSWMERVQVLWLSPLVIAVVLAGLGMVCWLAGLSGNTTGRAALATIRLSTAALVSCTVLLLLENFTLTVLDFGIRDTAGWTTLPYWLLFIVLLTTAYRRLSTISAGFQSSLVYVAAILLLGSLLAWGVSSVRGRSPARLSQVAGAVQDRVNVIFLSSDGLDAANMSVYGYERMTTPFLSELASQSLVCENAFSNVSSTGGSLTSLQTGKLPTETRVIYPPDILRGNDAFEHLPAILRSRGYRNWHLSIRHYADPFDLNLQESFEFSNGQVREGVQVLAPVSRFLGSETAYFLGQTWDRMKSRLLHLALIRSIPDVYEEVTKPEVRTPRDGNSLGSLIGFLETTSEPFLAQIHLMGTHGPRFRPPQRVFSEGSEQVDPWMQDFYDDAVLAFDDYVRRVVTTLRDKQLLERTILVIHTDHAQRFRTGVRIPLMFRFPEAQHRGRIQANTQLLDVAPTVLDYIGVTRPDWMSGRSLISADLDPLQPIVIATQRAKATVKIGRVYEVDPMRAGPPFFSMGRIRAVICNALYTLDLDGNEMAVSRIPDHTAPCPEASLPGSTTIRGLLIGHLVQRRYQVESITSEVSKDPDLFSQIEKFVQGLRQEGVGHEEIQRLSWEAWGDQIVALFNQKVAEGEPVPSWLSLAIDWAESRSRVELVQREPRQVRMRSN